MLLAGIFIVILLVGGISIAVAMGLPSMLYILISGTPTPIIMQRLFAGIDSTSLLAIPFFILAGDLMARGGIAKRLVDFCEFFVGKRRAGLPIVTIVACAFFAALSGSTVGCCAALGTIMVPEMVNRGYERGFASGVVCSGSVLGPIIPPSIAMIVYASMTTSSLSNLYKTGFPGGILMAIVLGAVAWALCRKNKYGNIQAAIEQKRTFKGFLKVLINAIWALGTPIIILGGIFGGICTPTEAAVLAVVYSLIVSLVVYKEIKLKDLPAIFISAAKGTAKVMVIMSAASLFAWLLTYELIPQKIVTLLLGISENKYVILLILNIIMLIMGMLMDSGSIYLILLPLILPVLKAYNIDLIHFGLVSVINLSIGAITPPFGTCLFVGADIGKVQVQTLAKRCMPFLIAMIAVLFIITYIPQIVMWIL